MVTPMAMKTGTTIVGVVYEGGIVLGADTRATAGTVADKNCEKIHYIAPNIWCCGAGTAADTEMTTALIGSQLDLLRRRTGTQSRVVTAMTMLKRMLYKYQGHIGAALVLGGVDVTGAHLYTIYPHGSTDKLPFVTMGSGSLAAMSVFESEYKDGMNEAEAKELVCNGIRAGIFNDLGSGSNVDLCVIRKPTVQGGEVDVDFLRGYVNKIRAFRVSSFFLFALFLTSRPYPLPLSSYEKPNEQSELRKQVGHIDRFDFPKGCTRVLKKIEVPLSSLVTVIDVSDSSGALESKEDVDME